jgi:predicted membrane-bound mannosyltransferase/DNA-binding beta-propeller fold protein YncE
MTELSQQPQSHSRSEFLSRPIGSFISLDWERSVYLLLIILCLLTRFYDLGDRVVSHDESLHTQYSYQYYNGDGYVHQPLMHGPTLFHFTALSYWLFGDSDFAARVPNAILGTILVILPYFLRGWIGRFGAITASFLLLISPYITYYSRYIRHDIYVITFAAITFIAILHYMRERKDKYLWWFAVGLGLMFATMETAYIYVAIFGSFLVLRLGAKVVTADWPRQNFDRLRQPLGLIALAVILVLVGLLGLYLAPRMTGDIDPAATATATNEGFAADPNQPAEPTVPADESTGLESAMRWLQIGGIAVLAAGLYWLANNMRPFIDEYPEFDLIILFATLVLPAISAFFVVIVGGDPLDYALGSCPIPGQETRSELGLFFNRLVAPACREQLLSSGIIFSAVFLIINLAVSVAVGLWWNRRRWIIAGAIFHVIFLLFFTSFFTNFPGWTSGMIGSLGYWLEQHDVQRANQPPFFYLIVLPLYEFLPLIFTFLGVHLWAKKERLNKVLVYWVSTLVIALLSFSLLNWLTNRNLAPETEPSAVLAIAAGLGIILAAGIYFFLVYFPSILEEYELKHNWRGLINLDGVVGLVPYLFWWFLLSWVIYSAAGEKMAWLSSHFIFPMVIISGWYINEKIKTADWQQLISTRFALQVGLTIVFIVALFLTLQPLILGQISLGSQEAGNLSGLGRFLGSLLAAGFVFYVLRENGRELEPTTRNRGWTFAFFIVLALLTIRFTYMAAFVNADYTTEYLVYAHGAPSTKAEVLAQLEQLSMRLHGDKSIQVAFDNDSSWPYTWYLRDYPNRLYFGENPGPNVAEYPVIIVGSQNWSKMDPLIGNDYEVRTYTFLWWPMEEYRNISWNAIFGDPNAAPEDRRGIFNPGVRRALWNIFFYRDYETYGDVFGGSYNPGQWPLRHDLRMYIRKDILPVLWDHGIDAVAAEPPVDPYAEGELAVQPIQVIGSQGTEEGQLNQPRNLAIGPDGRLYVADSGNHRIQVFTAEGEYVTSWGSFGNQPGQFNEPWGLAVDYEFVYVTDTWNFRIQKFTLDGEFVDILGQGGEPVEGETGGGLFFGPRDIIFLPDGNLLITDTGNHRLQVLTPEGEFVQALGTQGVQPGQFYEPVGLAHGENDAVFYVADTWNGRIQQFSTDLFPLFSWEVDAWRGESIANKPYLTVNNQGQIFVTDPEGFRVLIFNSAGEYLGRFGQFSSGSDGFGLPTGIKVDEAGNVYIADAANHTILKFAPPLGDPAVDTNSSGSEVEEESMQDAPVEEEPTEEEAVEDPPQDEDPTEEPGEEPSPDESPTEEAETAE